MPTKGFCVAFVLSILVSVGGVDTALGQSCLQQPVGACWRVFGFTSGETYIPAGATCYCGGVQPFTGEGETNCWIPLCTKHTCPTCNNAGSPVNLATGNTYVTQQDIKLPGLGGGLTRARTWNSVLRSSLSSVGLFGPNWRSTYEERIYIDDDNTVAYVRGDGSVWNFVAGSSQTFTPPPPPNTLGTFPPIAPANLTASLFEASAAWTLILQNGEQR